VVVSGHVPPGHPTSLVDWQALAALKGTLVLLMAVERAGAIVAAMDDEAPGRNRGEPLERGGDPILVPETIERHLDRISLRVDERVQHSAGALRALVPV
jgi:hypothetical protein